tara:strand:+ start:1367 stop:2284 length:918 start_codon:yes stop_codon:yes gene_type:complete
MNQRQPSEYKDAKLDFSDHLRNSIRDYWWDYDFLQLMQKRLGLSKLKNGLDLGCGMGHWTRAILPHLHPEAAITGIDSNVEWIQEAIHLSSQRMNFDFGDAYSIPFPDETFDFVTCQTLLMHLEKPADAIKEMYRVLKKDGVIFLAEPNNYGNLVRINSAQESLSPAERLQITELYTILEEGKKIVGDGFMGIHYQLPKLAQNNGFKHVQCYRNDVVFNIFPPYKNDAQKAMLDFLLIFMEKGYAYIFPREITEKYFLAANNDKALYRKLMNISDKLNDIYKEQIINETFEGIFGPDMIITAAVK